MTSRCESRNHSTVLAGLGTCSTRYLHHSPLLSPPRDDIDGAQQQVDRAAEEERTAAAAKLVRERSRIEVRLSFCVALISCSDLAASSRPNARKPNAVEPSPPSSPTMMMKTIDLPLRRSLPPPTPPNPLPPPLDPPTAAARLPRSPRARSPPSPKTPKTARRRSSHALPQQRRRRSTPLLPLEREEEMH